MKKRRISKDKAQIACIAAFDIARRNGTALKLPEIDMDAIFAGRKTMTIDGVVADIARAVDIANAL